MTAGQMAPAVRSGGAAASRAIREITSTVGCLLILPRPRLPQGTGRNMRCRIESPEPGRPARHPRPEVAGPEHEVPPGTGHDGPGHGGARLPAGAGIEVTLLWHRTSGELTVSVTDAAQGASFALPVAADEALAAFHHPYAYAAAQGVAY